MAQSPSRQHFQWDDPLALSGQISEDERAVRDTAHAYCQEQLLPCVQEAFRHEKTDVAIFRGMGELGLLGATIPEECGGAGLNYVCYGLIAREVERVDSGYRSMMSVQSSLVMAPATRRRSRNACRSSRAANGSAASVSPSRTTAPIPAA